ncbi:T9SS type A sorting domain-containing protein, partial [bacterium]|nr:T9SS type A sorting domain-containing protein [bacterium]
AFQLAIWKLSDVRNGGDDDGIPHFCVNDGRGYPNIGDAPLYPFVNTVYNSNPWRNDWANDHILGALGKNVYLPGDFLLCSWDDPVIEGNSSTLTIKWCLERGAFAQSVNNLGVVGVCIDGSYQVAGQDPVNDKYYTDEDGCFYVSITQPLDNPQPVTFTVCTNSSWPVALEACDQSNWNKQRVIVAEEPTRHCQTCLIPGEPWFNVELASFDAVTTTGGVELLWATASENNTQNWVIERRATEAESFVTLAEVAARNLPTGANYRYTDQNGVVGRTYEYRLTDVDMDGVRTSHGTRTAVFGSNSGNVLEYALNDAFPNPFNPTTTISFTLPEAGYATLRIFDISGREIAELVNGNVNAGATSIVWNAEGMATGTYFYTLEAGSFSMTKKLMLLK